MDFWKIFEKQHGLCTLLWFSFRLILFFFSCQLTFRFSHDYRNIIDCASHSGRRLDITHGCGWMGWVSVILMSLKLWAFIWRSRLIKSTWSLFLSPFRTNLCDNRDRKMLKALTWMQQSIYYQCLITGLLIYWYLLLTQRLDYVVKCEQKSIITINYD